MPRQGIRFVLRRDGDLRLHAGSLRMTIKIIVGQDNDKRFYSASCGDAAAEHTAFPLLTV
jgi:hypothetical protein